MNIDRTGVFRVKSTEHGLGQTKLKGYPQFNVVADVTAHYDEDNAIWVDYSEYGMDLTIRQCLFGMVGKTGDKKVGTTLGYDNVCKVFKWDGADLQVLAETEPGVEFQVTIVDNDPEYADKNPFQISWIDDFDADPTQKIAKCTPEEVKGLQAKYAALLKAKATPAAPAKAGAKKTGKVTKKAKAAPKAPPKAPAAPVTAPAAAPVAAPPETKQVTNYTKAQAWQICAVDLRSADCDDEQLNASWQAAIHDVSGGKGEEILDGEGWWSVKNMVLKEVGVL